ncbi:Thaumatin-like protein 1 [Sarracenia purpurea var. burkii]
MSSTVQNTVFQVPTMATLPPSVAFFSICLLFTSGVLSTTFTIVNQCSYTVWPGILSGAGTPQLSSTGFALLPGQSTTISPPTSWSGRLWGRTLCSTDSATGKFTCATANCGSGTVECAGSGAVPPATLAEFTLNGAGGLDFYDVSLVDGYNLPMLVVPHGGTGGGNCSSTGCVVDLNGSCPAELRMTTGAYGTVACKSACEAFGDPRYCCSGAYATPNTCKPTNFSEYFKSACPRAYSYAYDDGSSTFTCAAADYVITFCATPAASQKSTGSGREAASAVSLAASGDCRLRCSSTPSLLATVFLVALAVFWRLW